MRLHLPIIVLLALVLLSFGCAKKAAEPVSPPEPPQHVILKGITLTPKDFSQEGFTDFLAKAKQAGSIVAWYGDWAELAKEGSAPYVVADLAPKYGFTPLIVVQFFQQDSGKLVRPLDSTTKGSYKASAVSFATHYKPEYLGIGIEVNILHEKSPQDFDAFVDLYADVYSAVKEVSPRTKVFTVFQLERMKGLKSGLFGGEDTEDDWELVGRFKSDVAVFTTYPDLIFKSPSDIPDGYYDEINLYTSAPVAFTEIGWHTASSPVGWESSVAEQADFVKRFFALTSEFDAEFFIWSFMYDQQTIEPFRSMGLVNPDATPRPAWGAWVEID
jgi:hypothetical protein